jgi:molybdopterin-synthase adenylyltransferase
MSRITDRPVLRFKHGDLGRLRERLLEDSSHEHFAILFGRSWQSGTLVGANVHDTRFLDPSSYESNGLTHVRIKKDAIHVLLAELVQRYDVDTLIDVHTHPFCEDSVSFSPVDDADERRFFRFLRDHFDNLKYGSLLLSQNQYSLRFWQEANSSIQPFYGVVHTQTQTEHIPNSTHPASPDHGYEQQMLAKEDALFNRGTLALGLDVMRRIIHDQIISIVGVGGVGSIIAEHLVHMGFHSINLIDPDRLETSNISRVVGAYYQDAETHELKVDVVRRHLTRINPGASISAYDIDIMDSRIEPVVASSTWLILATDNHSSRYRTQQLSARFFVPLISVGVNISVKDGGIQDISGEVITVRPGDGLCLMCLGRINHMKIAAERDPDGPVSKGLVQRGYITGHEIREPAVKTLNSMLATLAVDVLINQYTEQQPHVPLLVYDGTRGRAIYEDHDSINERNMTCFFCGN